MLGADCEGENSFPESQLAFLVSISIIHYRLFLLAYIIP